MSRARLIPCLAFLALGGLLRGADQPPNAPPPTPPSALPEPQPTLPPEPRTLQIQTGPSQRTVQPQAESAQPQALIDDITALKQAVERVRAAVAHGDTDQSTTGTGHGDHGPASPFAPHLPDGNLRTSAKLGERLAVQRYQDGSAEVTASIDHEPLETVLRELAALLGRPLDDSQLSDGRRSVALHLKAAPSETALDRLLGQAGLAWTEGPDRHVIVLVDLAIQPLSAVQSSAVAQRALFEAARDHQTPIAAQAQYLLAKRDMDEGHQIDALRRYSAVAEEYGTSKDPALRLWGDRAVRGIGDAMMALGQYQDARGVYLNYIGRANEHDPDLPQVYLDAAKAGRALGQSRQDTLAFDESIDTLHNLLERFSTTPAAAAQVNLARLMVGELLFDAGRYREAQTQLTLFAKASGGKIGDQIAFWLAECDFHQGHNDAAQPTYTRLYRDWHLGRVDPQVSPDLYATAALRIGQCYEQGSKPRYVHALFTFLHARQDFPHSQLDAEMLISIARCYAELQRDDDTVATLWDLLKEDGIIDPQKRQVWLDDAISKLSSQLGDYSGPVRAKVLFYIAQADYRRALRDRTTRASACDDAVHHYERVIAENPPVELRHAAALGLARAALLGGQDERGVQQLKELLHDPQLSQRDRDYASQQLGAYYHDKGQLREAIKAYRGEVDN